MTRAGPPRAPRPGSLAANALGMVSGRVASMALGFLFWLAAAHLFDPTRVGLTAGAVAAMMLCTQLALLGIGSACIVLLPRHEDRGGALLGTAVTLVALSSLAVGALFVGLASVAFGDLRVVAASPGFAVLFLVMCVLGTENILLDQVSMSRGRGAEVLTRNVAFGLVTVGALVAVHAVSADSGPAVLFSTWVAGGLAACAFGAVQLGRTSAVSPVLAAETGAMARVSAAGMRVRPGLAREFRRPLVSTGLPNHLLTLTERAPGLVLPVVVTELLSPAANAFWYATWMVAWVVYVVPLSVGMAVFADGARDPARLPAAIRAGARSSLAWSVAGAAAVAIGAHLVLSMLGADYARAGATPLRVLVLAVVPLTAVQAYYAACRAQGRLREAVVVGAVTGVAAVAAAALAAGPGGLAGMAWAWVGTQVVAGAWAAWRLRPLLVDRVPSPAPVGVPGHPLGLGAAPGGAITGAG